MLRLCGVLLFLISFNVGAKPIKTLSVDTPERLERSCIIPEGFQGLWAAHDFELIRENMQGKFILCAPIEFPANTFFLPLGKSKPDGSIEYFEGILDGNGFRISGLRIDEPEMTQVGLFRGISPQGAVLNLRLDRPRVFGKDIVGSLAGVIEGRVQNIHLFSPQVGTSTSSSVGSIAGILNSSSLDKPATLRLCLIENAEITASHTAGGIVGQSLAGVIERCEVSAHTVGLGSQMGGAIGIYRGSPFIEDEVRDVHVKGTLMSSAPSAGGFVGLMGQGARASRIYTEVKITSAGGKSRCVVGQLLRSHIAESYFNPRECQIAPEIHRPLPPIDPDSIANYRVLERWDFREIWATFPTDKGDYQIGLRFLGLLHKL